MTDDRTNRQAGFTLIEITIATLLFALVVGSIYSIYVRGEKSQQVGIELAEANQNARSGVDLISRELRSAGYGVNPSTQPSIVTASQYRVTFALDYNGNHQIDMGEVVTYFLDPTASDPLVAGGNPYDFVLRRKVGTSGDSLATPAAGTGEIVAYGLTQRSADNVTTKDVPLFSYLDANNIALEQKAGAANDAAGVFWGKTVSDADLGKPPGLGSTSKVKTVIVSMVTETKQKNVQTGSFDRVNVSTAVEPRNLPFLAAANSQYASPNTGATGGTGTGSGTGTGTATGSGTGSGSGTGTGTGTGSGTGLPPSQPPIHIPTDRVLSLVLADLNERDSQEGSATTEDGMHDLDITVGTKSSGVANIRSWWNGEPGRYTGNVYFQTTESFMGNASYDVRSMAAGNLDNSDPSSRDLVAGIVTGTNTGAFQVWLNQAFGGIGQVQGRVGQIGNPTTPNATFFDSPGTGEVNSVALGDLNQDGNVDVVLGTKTNTNQGKVEVWFGNGAGGFTHSPTLDVYTASGEVRSVVVRDMNNDGWPDIIAGTKTNNADTQGTIDIFYANQLAAVRFSTVYSVATSGSVYGLAVRFMDNDGWPDVVTAVRTGNNTGQVGLWHNNGTIVGALTKIDQAATAGPAISLAVGPVAWPGTNNDIVVGTAGAGGGIPPAVQAFFCDRTQTGTNVIPVYQNWADANAGGPVNAVGIGRLECSQDHLDQDPLPDIVAGVATSSSTGTINIYLNPYAATIGP